MHSPLQPGRHDGSFPPHACPALPRPVTDHLLTSTPPLAAPGPWWLAATKGQGDVPQLPSLQPCHPSLCASIGASKCTRPDRSYLARYPAWPFAVGVSQARWTASTHCPQQPPPPHRDPRPKPSSCSPPAASVMGLLPYPPPNLPYKVPKAVRHLAAKQPTGSAPPPLLQPLTGPWTSLAPCAMAAITGSGPQASGRKCWGGLNGWMAGVAMVGVGVGGRGKQGSPPCPFGATEVHCWW